MGWQAIREELISRNVAELVTLPKPRKKNRRKSSWTVDEARKFLECSRAEDDPLYPLWVLILVLGLRKGEALGLIAPDEGWRADEDTAVIDLEWQLQRVGGHPLTHKQVLKADGSTDTLPLPAICITAQFDCRSLALDVSWFLLDRARSGLGPTAEVLRGQRPASAEAPLFSS